MARLATSYLLTLLLGAFFLTCGASKAVRAPGVGLHFTPDYSIAAIHFENGTAIEVSRIPSSSQFRSFMIRDREEPPVARWSVKDWLAQRSRLAHALRRELFPCKTLSECDERVDLDSAVSMVTSLKDSVEAVLGTAVCYADMAVADRYRRYQTGILEEAVVAAGLRQTHEVNIAALVTASAVRVGLDDRDAWMLIVDYSSSGLNVLLGKYEGRVPMDFHNTYKLNLGAGSEGRRKNLQKHFDDIRRVIEGAVKQNDKTKVDHLVLFGDRVDDEAFHGMMRKTLGDELVDGASVLGSIAGTALETANWNFLGVNDLHLSVPAAFGCRWRSGLYPDSPHLRYNREL